MLTEFYRQERIPLEKAFGKEYPSYFLDPDAEYNALVNSCGVIDLTHWRILRAQGKDVTEVTMGFWEWRDRRRKMSSTGSWVRAAFPNHRSLLSSASSRISTSWWCRIRRRANQVIT
jgi:hypothetical protein